MSRSLLILLFGWMCLQVAFAQEYSGLRQVDTRSITLNPEDGNFVAAAPAVIPFSDRHPFITLALRFPAAHSANTAVEISWREAGIAEPVRYRLAYEEHGPENPEFKVTELVFLPEDATNVTYRITSDQPRNIPVELHWFIPPGHYSGEQASLPAPPRRNGCEQPSYITRTGWNCPSGQAYSNGTPSFTTVTHLAVHHTAGSNASSNWPAVVLSIWNYHRFTNGWDDIAYNMLIDPNGVIYEGRGGNAGYTLDVISAATCGSNSGSMAVCLLGNFELVTPSSASVQSLEEVLAWKSASNGIDPDGSSSLNAYGVLDHIFGHRQGCSTACPGAFLFNQLPAIRTVVSDAVDAQCADPDPAEIRYVSHSEDDNNDGDSQGDGDGIVEAGETIEVFLTLENVGGSASGPLVASVATAEPCVSFIDANVNFTAIAAGGIATAGDLDIVFSAGCSPGLVPFDLTISGGGGVWTETFLIEIHGACDPIAAYSADQTLGVAPMTVSFFNQSVDAQAYAWSFPGGNPASSQLVSPTVVYNATGIYDVSLIAFNECGTDTLLMENYIEVDVVNGTAGTALQVSVYPNPVSGPLHIALGEDLQQARTLLYHTGGQLVHRSRFSGRDITIPMEAMPPGLYILRIEDVNGGRLWATPVVRH